MSKGKIFTAQEVQAIISGNKRMFREVIKPQLKESDAFLFVNGGRIVFQEDCVPYQVGQKIFVKESFADFRNNNSDIFYKLDFEINNLIRIAEVKWKPASHMKQEHSRLTLQIKEIRVEKLQDISDEDCWSDGLDTISDYADWAVRQAIKENQPKVTAKDYFREKWNATHKKPEEKFEANPFVWSIQFEVVK